MATQFPANRFVEAGTGAAQIATLAAAWALLSGPAQDAEAAYLAGVDNLTVAAITSFPISGGGYPAPQPPSGQVIEIVEGAALAVGSAVTGATAGALLQADGSGKLASGPAALSVANASSAASGLVPVANGSGGYNWESASAPTTLGGGGFRRVNANHGLILDVSANADTAHRTVRNPRGFKDRGQHVILFSSDGTDGFAEAAEDICYATGPSLANLTYQGVLITAAAVAANRASVADITPGCIIEDASGGYHTWVEGVDGWNGTTTPSFTTIQHLTASSPAGPWTFADTALDSTQTQFSGASKMPSDVCAPVFWGSQWVMAIVALANPFNGGTGRQIYFATCAGTAGVAPTGPWTFQTSPPLKQPLPGLSAVGFINCDNPCLIVDGNKMFMWFSQGDGMHQLLYEFTNGDLISPLYIGPVVQVSPFDTFEYPGSSNAGWGQGSMYRGYDDGRMYAVWEGVAQPIASNYFKMFGGQWVPGLEYVPLQSTQTYNGTGVTISNAGTLISLPSLPAEAIAIDLAVEAYETSTFTADEFVQIDAGTTTDTTFRVYVPLLSSTVSVLRARFNLDPVLLNGSAQAFRAKGTSTTTAKINWTLCGYWRLP